MMDQSEEIKFKMEKEEQEKERIRQQMLLKKAQEKQEEDLVVMEEPPAEQVSERSFSSLSKKPKNQVVEKPKPVILSKL